MSKRTRGLLCLAFLASAGVLSWADAALLEGSPYRVILDRNPFGLKPATNAPGVGPGGSAATNATPVATSLKLAGISAGPDGKRVYLVAPPQAGRNTNTVYYTLQAGFEEQGVKVLEIGEREVKILNSGTPMTLTFADNGFPAPSGPVVTPGKPVVPGAAAPGSAVPMPPPQQVRTAMVQPMAQPGMVSAGGAAPAVNSASLDGGGTGGSRAYPSRNLRTAPTPTEVDPEVRADVLRRQEAYYRSRGLPWPPQPPPLPGGGQPTGDE